MSEYSLNYMREHCIDVYFNYNDNPFHILTYGTTIPVALNNVETNRLLQHQVAVELERGEGNTVEVQVEQSYVAGVLAASRRAAGDLAANTQLLPNEKTIVQMFKPMAKLGFYSYDCIEELNDGKGRYRLVAYPVKNVDSDLFESLPVFNELNEVNQDEATGLIMSFML